MFRRSAEKRFSLVWVGLEDFPRRLKVVFSCAFVCLPKEFRVNNDKFLSLIDFRVSTALHAFVVSGGKLNYSKYFLFWNV